MEVPGSGRAEWRYLREWYAYCSLLSGCSFGLQKCKRVFVARMLRWRFGRPVFSCCDYF